MAATLGGAREAKLNAAFSFGGTASKPDPEGVTERQSSAPPSLVRRYPHEDTSPLLGKAIVSLSFRPAFKWAAMAAVAASSLLAAGSASAEVNWSIGIGAPVYYEAPAPVYPAPPPVYYEPPPRVYYGPPPQPRAYYSPAPVYYGPAPAYYGSEFRGGYRHRHHERRDRDDRDD